MTLTKSLLRADPRMNWHPHRFKRMPHTRLPSGAPQGYSRCCDIPRQGGQRRGGGLLLAFTAPAIRTVVNLVRCRWPEMQRFSPATHLTKSVVGRVEQGGKLPRNENERNSSLELARAWAPLVKVSLLERTGSRGRWDAGCHVWAGATNTIPAHLSLSM